MKALAVYHQRVLKCHFTANEGGVIYSILAFFLLKIGQPEFPNTECFALQRAANQLAFDPDSCEQNSRRDLAD